MHVADAHEHYAERRRRVPADGRHPRADHRGDRSCYADPERGRQHVGQPRTVRSDCGSARRRGESKAGRQDRHDREGHREDAGSDHEDPGREPAEAPSSQVRIVLIVPVCHETATTEAPTTSPMMLVIEEIPSGCPEDRRASDGIPCTGPGRRSCPRRTTRESPLRWAPPPGLARRTPQPLRAPVHELPPTPRPSEGWIGRLRSRHRRLPMRDAPSRTTTSLRDRNRRSSERIRRITRPPRGRRR